MHRLALGSAFLAALALLLNMVVWAYYAPAMSVGILTPICTVDGPALVAVDARTGLPLDIDASEGGGTVKRHCPLGLLAAGLSVPPVALPPGLPSLPEIQGGYERPGLAPRGTLAFAWQARAPPAG
ncbi:hypothetical protein RC1_1175 [Rhodospirillum centenum SW]|uniref:DUF2946 domain-containing protein n=1 Tax=Rhodospirillum centenum (strain ATCC 51521 / SW) TaxID=414684 RepID=B6IML0_RHOCS|nr:hypothetical protein RC1_1175 [Rhodospirillum centenum SW]